VYFTFLTYFANSGILLLLVDSNLTEQDAFLRYLFYSQYYDYSSNWYSNVGFLIAHTMMIGAVLPFFFCMLTRLMSIYTIRKDQEHLFVKEIDSYQTKAKNIF
jgi:hypothetical protein